MTWTIGDLDEYKLARHPPKWGEVKPSNKFAYLSLLQ